MRLPGRRRGLIAAVSAVLLAGVGVAGFATVNAGADSTLIDGNYACAFGASTVDCSAVPIPTVTDTATVTETATATQTVTVSPTPTPTPSPSPTAAVAVTGVSTPGLSVWPDAKAVRIYWSGLPSSTLPATPAGALLVVSFKTVPTSAVFGADLDAWAASGHVVDWTWHHEPDNGDMSGAAFVSQMNSLLAVAAGHRHPGVHSSTILTAGALANGTAESYYVPGVDVVGFDCYNLANEPKAIAYAAGKAKPLLFGEVGNKTTGQANSDSQALAYAKAFWPALTSNVVAALWWSGSTDTLTDKPATLAYLRSQP